MLNDLLAAAGLDRERDTFVVNIVKCWPPGNRVPQAIERNECMPLLYEQIRIIDPMAIVPVGGEAMSTLMGKGWKSIKAKHGELGYVEVPAQRERDPLRYPAVPIFHPSFILREDRVNEDGVWDDNGPAQKTKRDLILVRKMVEELGRMYNAERRLRGW